jgi:hypothetical protein
MAPRKPARTARTVKKLADTQTAAARRAEALLDEIARRKVAISEAFYDIGEALREILKKKLYAPLGYPSFKAMLTARKVLAPSVAHQLIDIVESIPREKALPLGSAKAYALARFAAATAESDPPVTLIDEGVPLGPAGARKAVNEVTVRELEAAARKARTRRATATRRDVESKEKDAQARALATKLGKRLRAKVKADARKRGASWWAVVEMPLAAFEKLAGR